MKLSWEQQRFIGGGLVLLWLPIFVNYVFGLGLFGDYDRYFFFGGLLVMFVYVLGFGPTLEESQKRSDQRDLQRYGRIKNRDWVGYVIAPAVALFLVFARGTGGRIVRGDPLELEDWFTLAFSVALVPYVIVKGRRLSNSLRNNEDE